MSKCHIVGSSKLHKELKVFNFCCECLLIFGSHLGYQDDKLVSQEPCLFPRSSEVRQYIMKLGDVDQSH